VLQALPTRLRLARLGYVTAPQDSLSDWEQLCRGLYGAGVDIILIRQRRSDRASDLAAATAAAQRAAQGRGRLVGLSAPKPPDFAVDLLYLATRDRLAPPPDRFPLTGRPAETLTEAAEQATDPAAAFFTVGPVQAEEETSPARGLALVRAAARLAPVADLDRPPWFATGGVLAANLDAVLEAGARRLIVHRAIAEAADPLAEARRLADRLRQAWLGDPSLTAYARAVRAADGAAT
jgi:thiamine-phosphate pyrophosphorylase